MNKNCFCGSTLSYTDCCKIIHQDPKSANSAEQLMRARYSAFTLNLVNFLFDTFHPQTRRFQKKSEIEQWSKENQWMGLQIIKVTENTVEFIAKYLDSNNTEQSHHEKSRFQRVQNIWYYVDGKIVS